jgi:tyrosyl-tRNA synthetase
VIESDVEIGATEQKFNLLTGRDIQMAYGVEPQVILTLPVLEGLDGVRRMSKSLGNYIGVSESPKEIFGKAMSLPDSMIERYFRLVTDATDEECAEVARSLRDPAVNPMVWKKTLAHRLVRQYHGKESADRARDDFEKQFSRREIPEEMPVVTVESGRFRARDLVMRAFPNQYTGSAAGNLFRQGAVYFNGERVTDVAREFDLRKGKETEELVIKVGRKFAKVVAA